MDVDTIRSLEEALLEFAGCVLVVSHDRYFLDRICTHILSFEGEGAGGVQFFTGNYQEYDHWRKETLGAATSGTEGRKPKAQSFAKLIH